MSPADVLSAEASLADIQQALNGAPSRRMLRREARSMLLPGYLPGPLHLTRGKFKPGRKLLAYFTFPVLDAAGDASYSAHLAVAWQKEPDEPDREAWDLLQAEAHQTGLMPVQCDLWKVLPEQGMKLQLWPFDPEFPQLVRLGSPSHVARMLTSLGVTHDPGQMPVITPIRYRPGERHVLRYEVGSGQRLYAKLYTSAEDAARAFGVADRVVDWLTANQTGLLGNKPEAMSQEDSVILYPHAPGIPLSRQLRRSPRWLAAQLQTIGRALAVLHSGPEALQAGLRQNNFTSEAKVVRRASEHIQALLPEAYARILETVEKAQERYSALPQEKPTFTHADFKADHILSTPQGLTLIDFDTCTLTDPALDLGKFLADLDWWFAVQGIPGVEEAQAELLKGYFGDGQPDAALRGRLERARLLHALILVKIAARRVPIYRKQWAALTEQIVRRAAAVLERIPAS
jgi:Ser/Thr protein kinase RdoA (MazF antagonist)